MIDSNPHAHTPTPLLSPTQRHWLHRLVEPAALFTGLTVLALTVIWMVTLGAVEREKQAADRRAAVQAADMANTYEAQVVRALREIDMTLKLVRYHLDDRPPQDVLEDLRQRDILPPSLLFEIRISNADGNIVASTHDIPTGRVTSSAPEQDAMTFDISRQAASGEENRLAFRQHLTENEQEEASGWVTLLVDAAYFVSGYDKDKLGKQGVLGLVGTSGTFLVRRTGDTLRTGTQVDLETLLEGNTTLDEPAQVRRNDWDGVHRYLVARPLFEFPVVIVLGLSQHEQMAAVASLKRIYYKRAMLISVVVLAVLALLGALSVKLRKTQAKILEERLSHAEQAEYLAFHDVLTGLPNRALFNHLLFKSLQHAHRYDKQLVLLFLDLDRFKEINDTLGHDAGDELLQEVSRRLSRSIRESDTVARIGGDEFVVLITEITEPSQITQIADKILAEVSTPFTLVGQALRITVSIGIAQYPADGEDEQTLRKHADVAMYHAKQEGKNNAKFYSEQIKTDALERQALESQLRKALEHQEFVLYYQPKFEVATGRITGMKALLRWRHPTLGVVLPNHFISVAEENGLIVPIGRWLLVTACRQNVAWQKAGFPTLSISVNLSTRHFFDEGLLRDIEGALQITGMAPELLEIAITESMMLDGPKALRILQGLKEIGVRIAFDDFGAGYSSLSKLKVLPIDTIKIDGSIIQDLDNKTGDKHLIEAIINLGKKLGLTVIAEGVESEEQASYLYQDAYERFQGFYKQEPQSAYEAELMMSTLPPPFTQ